MLKKEQYVWVILRLLMGWTFLWAFFDKLFGLGFATKADKAWILGNSPTYGFLKLGTHGPFASFFQSLAGNVFVDWLFMMGLLFLGIAFLFGIGVRLASYLGSLLFLLMWLALIPPANNPFLDEHIIYITILIGLSTVKAGHWFGFGKWWDKGKLARKYRFLQ